MLSRVRSLQGMLVLRPFMQSKLCRRLSQELQQELERIDSLSERTKDECKKTMAVMGRVALWPGRCPESIADGRFRSQEFSQEFEDVAVAVSERSDHRSTCSKSARIDRRLSAHRP